jgi:predicted thioesterase
MNIPIGIKAETTLTVSPDLCVYFMGTDDSRVLGTPYLIYNLEITARNAVLPHLEAGFDTVGTLVNVRHLAATPLGMQATFQAEVTSVEDRRVTFKVEAFDEKEKIAEGVHERTVINVARFAARVQSKLRGQS